MKKLWLLFLLISKFAFSQPCIPFPVDTLINGECHFVTIDPPAPSGIPITKCFIITPETQFLSFNYIFIQSSSCGPIAYSSLTYELYDSTCSILEATGQIFPIPTNNNITTLSWPNTYNLCLTWIPLCDQFGVCGIYNFSPLPIELLYFKGSDSENGILLTWMTATERDCDKFVVQRSTDFESWNDVISTKGSGNSISPVLYTVEDVEPRNGVNYYRLLQYDYDGAFEIFNVIAVHYSKINKVMSLRNYNLLGQIVRH